MRARASKNQLYVIYKGSYGWPPDEVDEFVGLGTAEECAKVIETSPKNIRLRARESYQSLFKSLKYIIIKYEESEDEDYG